MQYSVVSNPGSHKCIIMLDNIIDSSIDHTVYLLVDTVSLDRISNVCRYKKCCQINTDTAYYGDMVFIYKRWFAICTSVLHKFIRPHFIKNKNKNNFS